MDETPIYDELVNPLDTDPITRSSELAGEIVAASERANTTSETTGEEEGEQ